ncbi:MFS transporter [Baekduia sp. Peel2402]|uniref:MFS transporter n=1 Tax=Baekduia sp. Peel2402 TaxID=3458296 RepID=UPI00403E686E
MKHVTTTSPRTPDPRRWKALSILALADFVVILDATIVNIALPSIGRSLHASTSSLSWVVTAYILAFGGLLLLGGRLADLFGRRRLFVGGLAVFGIASLAGGLSTSIESLIAFRALQGAGAAALAPAARALVTTLFAEGSERNKALGIWAAVAGSGTVVGLILGGVLTSGLGWEWVFFINVPVVLAAALLAPRLIDESRAETTDRSTDVPGALLVSGGLVAALYAITQAGEAGWGSAQTLGLLAAASALLALFAGVESRTRSPLVPPAMLRLGSVRGANLAMVLMSAAMVGMFFVLTLYQQQVQGYSAIEAGLAQVPLGVVLIGLAGAAGPLVQRFGVKPILLAGLVLFAGGIAWLAQITAEGGYLTEVLGPSVVIGAGLALAFVALTVASASGVAEANHGTAGGLINMTQQIGGALGLAVATAVATAGTHGTADAAALTDGFRSALLVCAGIAAAAALTTAIALPGTARRRRARALAAA